MARNKVAITDTYNDCKEHIQRLAARFQRLHGGDLHDLISEANAAFVKHYHTFRKEKGTFGNHMSFRLWRNLMNAAKNIAIRGVKLSQAHETDVEQVSREHAKFNFTEFIEELSEDARNMVTAAIQCPKDVVLNMFASKRKIDSPYTMRKAIIEYFGDLGWDDVRINNTFEEIRRRMLGQPQLLKWEETSQLVGSRLCFTYWSVSSLSKFEYVIQEGMLDQSDTYILALPDGRVLHTSGYKGVLFLKNAAQAFENEDEKLLTEIRIGMQQAEEKAGELT